MTTMSSQITNLTVVYSTVYSDADQRKHQSSASLAFVCGIHRDRWIPHTKGQLRGKCFRLMTSSWRLICLYTHRSVEVTKVVAGDLLVFNKHQSINKPMVTQLIILGHMNINYITKTSLYGYQTNFECSREVERSAIKWFLGDLRVRLLNMSTF